MKSQTASEYQDMQFECTMKALDAVMAIQLERRQYASVNHWNLIATELWYARDMGSCDPERLRALYRVQGIMGCFIGGWDLLLVAVEDEAKAVQTGYAV